MYVKRPFLQTMMKVIIYVNCNQTWDLINLINHNKIHPFSSTHVKMDFLAQNRYFQKKRMCFSERGDRRASNEYKTSKKRANQLPCRTIFALINQLINQKWIKLEISNLGHF